MISLTFCLCGNVVESGEVFCTNCKNFYCDCGCGLSNKLVKSWCQNITDEKIFTNHIKVLMYNKTTVKTLVRFTKAHFPQYKEILDKYLVLI